MMKILWFSVFVFFLLIGFTLLAEAFLYEEERNL